jgi:hypothetical protein
MFYTQNSGDFSSLLGTSKAYTWKEDDSASPGTNFGERTWWVVGKAAAFPYRSCLLETPKLFHNVLQSLGCGATKFLSD